MRYALTHGEAVIGQVFTNTNSALAEDGWSERVRPVMEGQAQRLEQDGRRFIFEHPLSPARGSRLPADAKEALVADLGLHDPAGLARTGLYTIPESPVRSMLADNTVPSLLVVGERERRFADHRRYAEEHMPLLDTVGLDTGHAVNLEDADGF